MAKLKVFSPGDSGIFIAFHPADGDSYARAEGELKDLMHSVFRGDQTCPYKNREQLEIVYRVQRPVTNHLPVLEDFFAALLAVLREAQEYRPHFTQYFDEETTIC